MPTKRDECNNNNQKTVYTSCIPNQNERYFNGVELYCFILVFVHFTNDDRCNKCVSSLSSPRHAMQYNTLYTKHSSVTRTYRYYSAAILNTTIPCTVSFRFCIFFSILRFERASQSEWIWFHFFSIIRIGLYVCSVQCACSCIWLYCRHMLLSIFIFIDRKQKNGYNNTRCIFDVAVVFFYEFFGLIFCSRLFVFFFFFLLYWFRFNYNSSLVCVCSVKIFNIKSRKNATFEKMQLFNGVRNPMGNDLFYCQLYKII